MTLVKFKNRPAASDFNIYRSDFFQHFPSILNDEAVHTSSLKGVPVNIKESDNQYTLEVVAPGFVKEDFKIDLETALLTVSAEKKEESSEKNDKMIRKEFTTKSFKRSFSVDKSIDTDGIQAQYVNGILTLNLPKKEEVKPVTKQISVQ